MDHEQPQNFYLCLPCFTGHMSLIIQYHMTRYISLHPPLERLIFYIPGIRLKFMLELENVIKIIRNTGICMSGMKFLFSFHKVLVFKMTPLKEKHFYRQREESWLGQGYICLPPCNWSNPLSVISVFTLSSKNCSSDRSDQQLFH